MPGLWSLPGRVGLPPDVIFQRRPELHYPLFTAPASWRLVETEASSGLVGDQSPVRSVVVDVPAQVRGRAGHWRDTTSTQSFSHNITLSQSQDPGTQLGQIYQVLSYSVISPSSLLPHLPITCIRLTLTSVLNLKRIYIINTLSTALTQSPGNMMIISPRWAA